MRQNSKIITIILISLTAIAGVIILLVVAWYLGFFNKKSDATTASSNNNTAAVFSFDSLNLKLETGTEYTGKISVEPTSFNSYDIILYSSDTAILDIKKGTFENGILNYTITPKAIGKATVYAESKDKTVKSETVNVSVLASISTAYNTKNDEYIDRANEILSGMSIDEKIGQMFFVRCPTDEKTSLEYIEKYHLGGFVLFARDFENRTPTTLKEQINLYQKNSKINMLLGVDEEGGTVVRVSKYKAFRSTPFLSPQNLFKTGGFKLIKSDAQEKAKLLTGLGINYNLAPVCDIATKKTDYMYTRSFAKSATETSTFVTTVVEEANANNLCTALKHFPGYGNNANTHTGIAIDKRPLSQFESTDLKPFIAGINAGTDSILVSHNIANCFDNKYPASLSPEIHKYLRETMSFTGVILTDDLSMGAIKDFSDNKAAAVQAIKAGNDMLCCTDFIDQIAAVKKEVENKSITEAQINNSVIRILIMKLNKGIIK